MHRSKGIKLYFNIFLLMTSVDLHVIVFDTFVSLFHFTISFICITFSYFCNKFKYASERVGSIRFCALKVHPRGLVM